MEAATKFIRAAFSALAREHVIPTPSYHPWVRLGRDYFGDTVRGAHLDQLDEMLQEIYPQRFAGRQTEKHPEFPHFYTFSLLEAAIRRCGAEDGETYEPESPPVQEAINEFIEVLNSPDYTMSCCRAMSQMTTDGNAPLTIGDITIMPENGTKILVDQTLDVIPAAGSSFNRERPSLYDPPHSLLVTTITTSDPDRFGIAAQLKRRLDRFELIIRLLFAGTTESAWQVVGTSTLVSRFDPQYEVLSRLEIPRILMQRVIKFESAHATAIAALNDFLDEANVKRAGMVATSFDIALMLFNRSFRDRDDYGQIIDLVTALEAILTGGDDDTEGIGLRLRSRAAALLWTDSDPGRAIFNDIKKLYSLRSKLVHGARISENWLLKSIREISVVPKDVPYRVAYSFAVDRLRDLVRRAFLARLCLASGEEPFWQFEASAPVDEIFSDENGRARWRAAWRETLKTLGAASAADQAVRAVDPIREPIARPGR